MRATARVRDGPPVSAILPTTATIKTTLLEVQALPSDIDACVSFSIVRCVISIVSIALLLTDIPRTGLYLDLLRYYPKVGPDTTMSYGPYAYPVAHLNRSNASSSIDGFWSDARIDSLDVWTYKFDTLSIPTRALAEYLNVSSYPPCLLYKAPCAESTLDLDTTFAMLDDLMTAIGTEYFTQAALRPLPLAFYTTSIWSDRLHHVILGHHGRRIDVRLHTVYRFAVPNDSMANGINVCAPQSGAEWHDSLVCKSPVKWRCDHPYLGPQEQVSVAESIQLRVAALHAQYPSAALDITVITTRNEIKSPPSGVIPTVFFRSDNTEITTFVRGRNCVGETCTTIFVDDYRYERVTLETSSEQLQLFTTMLRAASQLYMWLRVALLFYVCAQTRLSEPKYRTASLVVKVRVVFLTLARIPGHVIVYSSWVPILGYAIANFVDCGLNHFISDSFWSSTEEFLAFDVMSYVDVASIQMRNIWILALVWKCGVALYNLVVIPRATPWQPQQGLIAFRGVFIGATSSLTIFTFLRALRFRDCRVLEFHEVARTRGAASTYLAEHLHKSTTDFGYSVEIKATVVASVIVYGFVRCMRLLSRQSWRSGSRSFFCHTFYVPLSTGVLFPASALSTFWYMNLSRGQQVRAAPRAAPPDSQKRGHASRAVFPFGLGPRRRRCGACDFVSTALHWRAVQGCRRHETLFDIGRRSIETQSMVRLVHIGVFSDPIVFFQLCVLGKDLFVYRVRDRRVLSGDRKSSSASGNAKCTTILSPIRLRNEVPGRPNADTRHGRVEYELVAQVSSTTVPWTHLADCG